MECIDTLDKGVCHRGVREQSSDEGVGTPHGVADYLETQEKNNYKSVIHYYITVNPQ